MNKMNKKGFTLIEMLVVIAIIAVLVSIVVPVVGNSTTKAAAAANAANLRSVAAEVAIKYMENPDAITIGDDGISATNGVLTLTGTGATAVTVNAPAAKAVKLGNTEYATSTTQMTIKLENGNIKAYYGSYSVDVFADIADNGKVDTTG